VDPLGVVVDRAVGVQAPKMMFAKDDHVIEKLSSTGSHPPLGDGVLPRTAACSAHGADARVLARSHDLRGEDRVAVKKEVAGSEIGGEDSAADRY
jgi:hypothetical protein